MRLEVKSMGYAQIRNIGFSFQTRIISSALTVLAALSLANGLTGEAKAQTPPEFPKSQPTEKQSPVNPFPFPYGDAQNRGRASADYYWGVTDANTPANASTGTRTINGKLYNGNALSRVPNAGTRPNLMELDGWGFPRGASLNGAFLNRPAVKVPAINGDGQGTIVDGTFANLSAGNANWSLVNGPSTLGSFPNFTYLRTLARPRPNSTSVQYATPAVNKTRIALWNFTSIPIVGTVSGQAVRFQVRVNLPTPGFGENRIADARYTVYYYLRVPGGFQARQKTFIVSQAAAGEGALLNENGVPAFFPIYSSATSVGTNTNFPGQPGLGVRFQGVVLDDTTAEQGNNLYVLADRISLVGSLDSVYATPTVTRPHGGRRIIPTVPSGTQPVQPLTGPLYVYDTATNKYLSSDNKAHAYLSTAANTVSVDEWHNNLSTFINNPFNRNPATGANPTLDPQDGADWTANPSTLFRGPESLAEPRRITDAQLRAYPLTNLIGDRVGPGTQNRVKVPIRDPITGATVFGLTRTANATDSNNQNIYRTDRLRAYDSNTPDSNPVVPYFSNRQVLMARTEYVLDPEDGVPPNLKDGTITLAVGSVWCLDSQTGTPLWRFPDRTYAPGNIRNPQLRDRITGALVFDSSKRPVYTIPGIRAIDKNLNAITEDDEVFIVGQGSSPSGGLFAAVTYVPKVPVRGSVQLPTYRRLTAGQTIRGIPRRKGETILNYDGPTATNPAPTITAPPGRYYNATNRSPVMVGVAYIAAANGVIYAVDAYGNNDNDYLPAENYRNFGNYRPGTTNVLWTFNGSLTLGRQNAETLPQYNKRLKREIPQPASYGQSAPIIAYRKDDKDLDTTPLDPTKDEPRLFIGNLNGYVYALDARADAGFTKNSSGITGVQELPFRKEQGRKEVTQRPGFPDEVKNLTGIKWWFAARGGINASPAVSLMRQDAGKVFGSSEADLITKGVYITSQEGRVYCIDWDGPVTRRKHSTPINTDNNPTVADDDTDYVNPLNFKNPPVLNDAANQTPTSGPIYQTSAFAQIAETLNDDYRFHNIVPATTNALADRTQGSIRPRWTYPNLYRHIRDDVKDKTFDQPIDKAYQNTNFDAALNAEITNKSLIEPGSSIGAITTPPSLMDFAFQKFVNDPTSREVRSYVLVQAHDAVQNGAAPTESRVYLLDQVGDRANFLSNPRARTFGTTQRISAYPRDRFSPKQVLGDSAPAWTYRSVYDTYNRSGTNYNVDISKRDAPIVPPLLSKTDARYIANPNQGVPSRKITPTVFIGGIGKVFAVDIDPRTGLFLRWRPNWTETRALTPLPEGNIGFDIADTANFFYKNEADRDLLSPLDPSLSQNFVRGGGLRNFAKQRILARVTPLAGSPSSVNSVVISGGPTLNRTVSFNPLVATPLVPVLPTNDAPNWNPRFFDLADLVSLDPLTFDFRDPFDLGSVTRRGLSHWIGQDINDPLTVTEGALSTDNRNDMTDANNRLLNLAYSYPMIFVTDAEGNLHSASSNIEGEDRSLVGDANPANNRSFTVGWPLFGVTENIENQFQQGHTLHFSQFGPGGPGGVAVVTDAYFPALDPAYRNTERATATPTDPYRYYPYGEPNTLSPTPYRILTSAPTTKEPVANNDDPRTDFRPRSLTSNAGGSFGADSNTGQSGFPLDFNGLFFDKRFAGKDGTVLPIPPLQDSAKAGHPANQTDANNNDTQARNGSYHVRLRLPGYSYIGGSLGAGEFTGGVNPNNQVADGARRAPRFIGSVRQVDNIADGNDDINPAGQNIAWIYSGGQGGLLYAFTPAQSGQTSGGAAGTSNVITDPNDRVFGLPTPKVAIVDPTTFESIRSGVLGSRDPRQLAIDGSIARKGGKNFYEWGETVYVVVYDLLGNATPRNEDDYYVVGGGAVQMQFINALQNSRSGGTQQALVTRSDGTIAYYTAENVNDPEATRLGVVLFKFTLGDNSQQFPQTPGDTIQVTATQSGVRRPGQLVNVVQSPQTTLESSDGFFSIANPIAIQGFLSGTTGALLGINTPTADVRNGIGPFRAAADQALGNTGPNVNAPKSLVSFANTTADGLTDPQKQNYSYAAALTNGNRFRRRDLRRFLVTETNIRLNPAFGSILKDANGGDDPEFYFPVMTNTGYINHGDTGTTDVTDVSQGAGATIQNLRIMNRSLLPSLKNVRVLPASALVWRYWPGRVPNADADVPGNNVNESVNNNNARYTPAGMDIGGRINPLPWETGVNEAKPWNPTAPGNSSPDYPDILTSASIKVSAASGNLTASSGSLAAAVNTTDAENAWVNSSARFAPDVQNYKMLPGVYATQAAVTLPKYQPANLVATHSLTSSYVPASTDDTTTLPVTGKAITDANPAPIQLPRGINNRNLVRLNPNGTATAQRDIAPYGYSSRMLVTVGNVVNQAANALNFQQRASGLDPNNRLLFVNGSSVAPYREFEMGIGVPVDATLTVAEQTIDLGTFGHSFGMENGLLGYTGIGDPAFATGLLPAPLFNTTLFPTNATAPYNQFFKKFTVQNRGNVNLWNLRSAQRIENPTNATTAGSGFPYRYLGLLSETVDQRFGILAAGTDPNANIGNLMPQIITSLDQRYDAAWDKYMQSGPPAFSLPYTTPLPDGSGSPYSLYYQQFAGRHTLHKPVVGVNAPAVGSVPDLPSQQYLRPVGDPQPEGLPTVVSVAVPLGTPSGTYSSTAYGQRFVVFEDHDTNLAYNGIPTVTGSSAASVTISPAGPLYFGSNVIHPGANKILTRPTAGPLSGEGIWRYRFNGTTFEPLPASDPGINLKLTVGESPLTGEVADRALENPGSNVPLNIASGRLPAVDTQPIIDASGQTFRAAAALSPAAYRTPDGALHVFFSRNFMPTITGFAQPGRPYKLYTSKLNWDTKLGVFAADTVGGPVVDARTNTGKWFTDATPETLNRLNPGVAATESNVSPFVLQPTESKGTPLGTGATLFWINTQPQTTGANYNRILYSELGADGAPIDAGQPFLNNYDPSVQRFSPRAVRTKGGSVLVMYYGGVSGRWSLFYSARASKQSGAPNDATPDATVAGNPVREIPLPLPASITSATDPAPVYRERLFVANNVGAPTLVDAVDVYYSGVPKNTQLPEAFVSRYRIGGGPNGLRLAPLAFPRITGEKLKGVGRGASFAAQNIGWNRDLNGNGLPRIYVKGAGNPVEVGATSPWQFDGATGVLYKSFTRGSKQGIVYVDTETGTARFRGEGGPNNAEAVYADYSPSVLRLSDGKGSGTGVFALWDNRHLPMTLDNAYRNSVLRRQLGPTTELAAGRSWLFYQKGAALTYAVRRVGINLKDIPTIGAQRGLGALESIALSAPSARGNSRPRVNSVIIAGTGVPYEADYESGRIYVAPEYEGLPVVVSYVAAINGTNQTSNRTVGNVAASPVYARQIDEFTPSEAVTRKTVNETQPYAFVDLITPPVSARPTDGFQPAPANDPTLQLGRVWLLWSSPRSRQGVQPSAADLFPTAYDLYWQTLAPNFEPKTFFGGGPPN